VLSVAIALLPVLLFLAALIAMDSFKLVRPAAVLFALSADAIAAILCLLLHDRLAAAGVPVPVLRRYVAPMTEEAVKGAFIVFLLARRRIGFLVDAAILGFAVGTGFALVENVDYLHRLPNAQLGLWIVRGLGTAVLHGGATAMFATIAKTLSDLPPDRLVRDILPALAAAAGVHALFNYGLLPPLATSLLLLTALPLLVVYVFQRSERATRDWIGGGLDLDLELLQLVLSEHFAGTHFGQYLQQLRHRFAAPVVVDMFCLLRLELELSVQARARVMARAAGVKMLPDADLAAYAAELGALRQSIGPTGLLALKPLQVTTVRDDWHRHVLKG
jgi:protease PrsW